MNERIKELAEQADTYAWEQIDEGANFDEQPRYFAEKFAELIVRECVSVCENEGYRLSMDTKTEHHRDLAKQCHKICAMMGKHFGVEE